MARKMIIMEYYSGKRHQRKIKYDCSISYGVEGRDRNKLVVRNYYTGEKLQCFDISKFGSIQYWVED